MRVEKQSKFHLMLQSRKASYQSICWILVVSIYRASVPITELATETEGTNKSKHGLFFTHEKEDKFLVHS